MTELVEHFLTEQYGSWTLLFSKTTNPIDASKVRSCYVDLSRDGVIKTRLGFATSGLTHDQCVGRLWKEAMSWIDDWEARSHTGTTDFDDLSQ